MKIKNDIMLNLESRFSDAETDIAFSVKCQHLTTLIINLGWSCCLMLSCVLTAKCVAVLILCQHNSDDSVNSIVIN